MKDLLPIAIVTAAALGFVGTIVGAGHDTTVLVSPPESVVEQFVRKLAAGRHDVARNHLEHDSPAMRERIRTVSDELRARGGEISQVAGKPGAMQGDEATAAAVITTERAGKIEIDVRLRRRAGSWRITEF